MLLLHTVSKSWWSCLV